MREVDKNLMTALNRRIAEKIRTGQESLARQKAVKEAFAQALAERLRPMIAEMVCIQKEQAIPHYLDCCAKHTKQDESFAAGLAAIGAAVGHTTVQAIGNGLGVDTKRLGRIVKAFRRKKPSQTVAVSKAPKTLKRKPKLTHPVSTQPIKIDRKEFAAKLRASNNRLDKTSLS
jgi:hypothetical protein